MIFSNRNISALLYTFGGLALATSACLFWWASSQVDLSPSPSSIRSDLHQQTLSSTSYTPPLDAFKTAWNLELQRPLYDPPPVVVELKPPPPPTPPAVRLSGTFIEPGNSRALIQDRSGATRVYRIGEVVDEAKINSITDEGVVVFHDNANWQLRVGKDPMQQ